MIITPNINLEDVVQTTPWLSSTLFNFTNTKKLKILATSGTTYWPISPLKNPDVLDVFVAKIPNSLLCHTPNLLNLNSDHSAVILTLNVSPILYSTQSAKLPF